MSGGRYLLALGEPDRASALVQRLSDRLEGAFYGQLVELARELEKAARPLPAVSCYRALIAQILREARSKAYRYGKRYLDRLAVLHAGVADYRPLPDHADYLAQLRAQHGRKHGFWRLVDGERA